ncbi:tRNA dihydrouridine synthase DusB [Candidatus Sumerlaeota bacterium]|nr:tRNA dihydrouridine synthase DusB [Candidatus Sumerlaeota bacterium]
MWNLGPLTLRSRVILAPMAGVSDRPTRTLFRRLVGMELSWTEMISSEGLVRDDPKTHTYLDIVGEEPPVIVQIFGRDPAHMAEAARIVVAAGAEGVDVNMGCPVPKVFKSGCGVALMRDPGRAAAIIEAMVEAAGPAVPVTAKFRAGVTEDTINCVEFARRLDAAGAAGVSLHPRTRSQMFTHRCDWSLIAEVRREVGCAVIGSGDVTEPADAVRMREQTGCDAVMIARAAQGDPWLLAACEAALEGRPPPPEPGLRGRCEALLAHGELAVSMLGERRAVREMRKHTGWYLRGQPGARQARSRLASLDTLADLRDLVAEVLAAAA